MSSKHRAESCRESRYEFMNIRVIIFVRREVVSRTRNTDSAFSIITNVLNNGSVRFIRISSSSSSSDEEESSPESSPDPSSPVGSDPESPESPEKSESSSEEKDDDDADRERVVEDPRNFHHSANVIDRILLLLLLLPSSASSCENMRECQMVFLSALSVTQITRYISFTKLVVAIDMAVHVLPVPRE